MPYSGWTTQLSCHEECQEGVPVIPPLRDRSPGRSYGTASRGLVPDPAMFPVNVPRAVSADRGGEPNLALKSKWPLPESVSGLNRCGDRRRRTRLIIRGRSKVGRSGDRSGRAADAGSSQHLHDYGRAAGSGRLAGWPWGDQGGDGGDQRLPGDAVLPARGPVPDLAVDADP